MKILMLAALAIAVPAIAQDAPPGAPQSTTDPMPMDPAPVEPTPADPSAAPGTMPKTAPTAPMSAPADPAAPAPTTQMPAEQPAPATAVEPATPPAAPMAASGETPAGGYGPTATSAPAPAGAVIRYQQAQSPDQAFPAPAPLAKYPLCKKGQTDGCMQRGGK